MTAEHDRLADARQRKSLGRNGDRISANDSGGPSVKTTARPGTPGTTSATTKPGLVPSAGARTGWSICDDKQCLCFALVAEEISRRLAAIFLRDGQGRRAVYGGTRKFQEDSHLARFPAVPRVFPWRQRRWLRCQPSDGLDGGRRPPHDRQARQRPETW
jgi:hypothetical protein